MSRIALDFIDRTAVRTARQTIAECVQAADQGLDAEQAVQWLGRCLGTVDTLLAVLDASEESTDG
ncbi:hypothetical protein [Streptomyces youssoufiensis]